MYKISIIESQPIIREGLCSLLSKQLEFDILSSYSDFTELLRDCESTQPDVVIFNLNLCDLNEVDAIQKIKARFVNIKILIFSTNDHEECIKCAFRTGAHGYIHKDATAQQLKNAIFSVTQGELYLSTTILPIVMNCFMRSQKQVDSIESTNLTIRESELLKLISSGYKNKEIADSLCLSVKTIEAHRSNLMKKLNVHNVASLTTKANQLGVIQH
jgi:DNA-binding NarL/FixJ family response regulator